MGVVCGVSPLTLTIVTSNIIIIMKRLEIMRDYQNVAERHELRKCSWKKVVLTDLFDAGLPQTFTV